MLLALKSSCWRLKVLIWGEFCCYCGIVLKLAPQAIVCHPESNLACERPPSTNPMTAFGMILEPAAFKQYLHFGIEAVVMDTVQATSWPHGTHVEACLQAQSLHANHISAGKLGGAKSVEGLTTHPTPPRSCKVSTRA